MKKILNLGFMILLLFSFIACNDEVSSSETTVTTSQSHYSIDYSTGLVEYPYQEYSLNMGINPLFKNDIIPIKNQENLYGYIDNTGTVVIDFQFIEADEFNDDGYAVVVSPNSLRNIIDKAGNFIFTDLVGTNFGFTMSQDGILVDYYGKGNNKYEMYNYDGIQLMNQTEILDEILEEYPNALGMEPYFILNDLNGVVLADSSWEAISEYSYSDMEHSTRGLLSVRNSNSYGIVNGFGIEIIEPIYRNQVQFGAIFMTCDLAPIVTEDLLLGFADYTGSIIIEPVYDVSNYTLFGLEEEVETIFLHGVQKVLDGNIYKIIDYLGTVLFETEENQTIMDYNNNLIALQTWISEDHSDGYVSTIIDYNGNTIYTGENKEVVFTMDDSKVFFAISRGEYNATMYNYQGYVLKENFSLLEERLYSSFYSDYYTNFYNGYMAIIDQNTEKVGFIDSSGNWVIEPQFDAFIDACRGMNAYVFHSDGFAIVSKDGLFGVIDKQGNQIIDCIYQSIPSNVFDLEDIKKLDY